MTRSSLYHKLKKLMLLCNVLVSKTHANIHAVISSFISIMNEILRTPFVRRKLVSCVEQDYFQGSILQKIFLAYEPIGKIQFVNIKIADVSSEIIKEEPSDLKPKEEETVLPPTASNTIAGEVPTTSGGERPAKKKRKGKKTAPKQEEVLAVHQQDDLVPQQEKKVLKKEQHDLFIKPTGSYRGLPVCDTVPDRLFPHVKGYNGEFDKFFNTHPPIYALVEHMTKPRPDLLPIYKDLIFGNLSPIAKFKAIVKRAHSRHDNCLPLLNLVDVPVTKRLYCCTCYIDPGGEPVPVFLPPEIKCCAKCTPSH